VQFFAYDLSGQAPTGRSLKVKKLNRQTISLGKHSTQIASYILSIA